MPDAAHPKVKTTLVAFMRHGPTAWNGAKRLQGRADIGLTPRTRDFLKARRIPHEFDGWPVLCSPLLRCRETAELLGLEHTIEPRLVEMSWGDFEGRTMAEMRAELGPALAENEARGLDFQPPNGESPRLVLARVRPLLAEIAKTGRNTLCVTHRGVFRAVYAAARGWDMTGDPPDKLDLYAMHVVRVAEDGSAELVELNLALKRRWRKILIHVQHLLGTGHTRRMAAIAKAMAARGHETILASGGMPLRLDLGAARLVQLPACRAADSSFKTLLDERGKAVDEAWRAARARATRDLADSFVPDLLLIELYPLGRSALRFELEPLVARAKTIPKLVSIRDVPQRPAESKVAKRIAALADFEAVLVHGAADFLPATRVFPELESLGERLIHTGYVAVESPPPRDPESGRDEILVSVGGGAAGKALLEAALALAARRAGPQERWRVLAGESGALPQTPSPFVTVETNRPDFPAILARARASISQAGYNTCVDLLRARIPAVLVPFAEGNEREQTIRAEAFVRAGLACGVTEAALSPETLGAALDAAKPPPALELSCEGAAQSARIVERWL